MWSLIANMAINMPQRIKREQFYRVIKIIQSYFTISLKDQLIECKEMTAVFRMEQRT